jgi:hypothetical protein
MFCARNLVTHVYYLLYVTTQSDNSPLPFPVSPWQPVFLLCLVSGELRLKAREMRPYTCKDQGATRMLLEMRIRGVGEDLL